MKCRVAFKEHACRTVYKILPHVHIGRSMIDLCFVVLDEEDLLAFKLAFRPEDIIIEI